jgi:hypothetical protein
MASTGRRIVDEQLQIKLAAVDEGAATAEEPLVADRALLAAFSSCVRGLSTEEVWDISQLLVEGEPVQRQTVVAWLNIAYSQILMELFEQQDIKPECSMTGLSQLLAFADSVGSSRGLLHGCLSHVHALSVVVSIPAAASDSGQNDVQPLQLSSAGGYYWNSHHTVLRQATPEDILDILHVCNKAEAAGIAPQVATQTEQLLFLAHKLQLLPLQQKLHAFLTLNTHLVGSLLYGFLGHTLTDRVLEVAMDK